MKTVMDAEHSDRKKAPAATLASLSRFFARLWIGEMGGKSCGSW